MCSAADNLKASDAQIPGTSSPGQKVLCRGKGKAIPLQAWTGPEGCRRLRLPDFMTFGT